jgi:hypothetical protein
MSKIRGQVLLGIGNFKKNKNMKCWLKIVLCSIIFIFNSCVVSHEKRIRAYDASTSGYEYKYVSIAVGVGYENSSGSHIDSIVGYAVLPFGRLSEILKRNTDHCFADIVFRKLCFNDVLIVDEKAYQDLFFYLISIDDANKWGKVHTSKLVKKYTRADFIIGNYEDKNGHMSYHYRCVIHNFIHNGICVTYNDDGGGLMLDRKR